MGELISFMLLSVFAVFGLDKALDLSARFGIPQVVSDIGGLVLFAIIILTLLKFSVWKKRDRKA